MILSVFVLLFVAIFLHLSFNVNPIIQTVAREEIKSLTTIAVNNAVIEVLDDNSVYLNLVEIEKDDEGNISLLRANSALINSLSRKTILASQRNISTLGEQGIHIPLGTMSGLTFLSGKGPVVSLNVLPVGTINTNFTSEFVSAGINQTRHKIYINIVASVSVVIPGKSCYFTTATEVLISENIIIGKVPDTYLQSGSLDEMLNLVP